MSWPFDGARFPGGAASLAGWSVGLATLLGLVATFSVLNREYDLDDALIY